MALSISSWSGVASMYFSWCGLREAQTDCASGGSWTDVRHENLRIPCFTFRVWVIPLFVEIKISNASPATDASPAPLSHAAGMIHSL